MKNPITLGAMDKRKMEVPQKEGVSVNSLMSIAASVLSLVAAFVAISGVQSWVSTLLGIFIALVMGFVVWRPITSGFQSLARRRREAAVGRELMAQAVDVAGRLHEQMEMRTDSLSFCLSALNRERIFGDYTVPHPVRFQMALQSQIGLMEAALRVRQSVAVVGFLSLFDMMFAQYHEHFVRVPADMASKKKDQIRPSDLGEVRKAWSRYEALIEDHRRLCAKANKVFGIQLGFWCHEMPVPL